MNSQSSNRDTGFQAGADAPITRLLFDVQAELGDALPDPSRLPFPELEPYYAYRAGEPLVERLVASCRDATAESAAGAFLAALLGALERCATQFLGRDRTLAVIDTAWRLAPEGFSNALWEELLWRAPVDQWPAWWRLMVMRLEEDRIALRLEPARWQQLVEGIEPAGLGALLRWAVGIARGPRRDAFVRKLLAQARRRCLREVTQFWAAEVDGYALLEAAEDFAEEQGITQGARTLSKIAQTQQELQRRALRDGLPKAARAANDESVPTRANCGSAW